MFYYSFIQSINDITNNDNQSLQKNIDVNNVVFFLGLQDELQLHNNREHIGTANILIIKAPT
jgi:hypothetical protein